MADHYNAAAWLVDRHVAAGNGDRLAVVCGPTRLTYGDLQRQVWRAQNALRQLGVRRGERVAMVLNDEPAFPAWFLGTLRAGSVPVPLSTMLTADDLGALIEDAEAGVVVVSAEYATHLGAITRQAPSVRAAVVIGDAGSDGGGTVHVWDSFSDDSEARVAPTDHDSPGFWLYSSGTTGSAKGIMHRHAALEATAATYAKTVLKIQPADRCLSVAKLFFAFGLGNSLTFPFSVGATTILNPARPTPVGIAALLTAERPTLFFASPGFVAALLDAGIDADAFASVRLTATAGEALPAELQRRFHAAYRHPVLDGLGSTEALHIFLSNREDDVRPGTSGTPVDGYQVTLLDERDAEVLEPGTPGYLHVTGPSIATGYWRCGDATRAAFRGAWLRTGDVYLRSADGHYTFLGRNSDMIKAGGIWVSPAEVESALIAHPDVLETAVVGARDANGLESVVAFVVPRAGSVIDAASIDAHCRKHMAAFKRPRRVVVVDELPKTATGKIQRHLLRQRLARETVSAHA